MWYIFRKSSVWYQYNMIFALTTPCLLSTVLFHVIELMLTFYNYNNVLKIPGCLIVQEQFQSGHLVRTSLRTNCKQRVSFVVMNKNKYCLLFRKNIRKARKYDFCKTLTASFPTKKLRFMICKFMWKAKNSFIFGSLKHSIVYYKAFVIIVKYISCMRTNIVPASLELKPSLIPDIVELPFTTLCDENWTLV